MDNADPNIIKCRNGHAQKGEPSRFCIYCGVPMKNGTHLPEPQFPADSGTPQQVSVPPRTPQQPPPQQFVPANPQFRVCVSCSGDGRTLDPKSTICPACKWLRPLAPGYGVEPAAFQWAEDGRAMSALRSVKPLTLAAQAISEKVGRRWIETLFNGVLLGPNQLPDVHAEAVRAARILGLQRMPDVYVSGEMMWDCRTYGSDTDAFIIMGSALATNFRGVELLFLFAREMGHCRTGHALWKTVIKFLLGEQGPRKGLMAGGLFSALSPTALIEGTLEMPLLAWARQAEIAADRAGLLAVGSEEIARRVLLTWSLKSPVLYRQINVEAWLDQQAAADSEMTRLSEVMTSSTPYITRRLHLVDQFARSPEITRWQSVIKQLSASPEASDAGKNQSDIRLKCSKCDTPMRVPLKVLEGKEQISVRCPNGKCGKLTYLKKQPKPASVGEAINKANERNLNYDE
jgi:Zn-dependent protease with chaperone function